MTSIGGPAPSASNEVLKAAIAAAEAEAVEISTEAQVASQGALLDEAKENPVNLSVRTLKAKEPEKSDAAKKAERVQESVLIRKDESDGFADSFNGRNKQYHLDRDQLSSLAQDLTQLTSHLGELERDLRKDPEMTESGIRQAVRQSVINFVVSNRPSDAASAQNAQLHVGQVDKTFDFLLFVMESKLKDVELQSTQKTIISKLLVDIKEAKQQFYAANKNEIDTAHKYINLADSLVEHRGETASINQALNEITEIVHNPPDFLSIFEKYQKMGASSEKIEQDMKDILHFIGEQFTKRSTHSDVVEPSGANPK